MKEIIFPCELNVLIEKVDEEVQIRTLATYGVMSEGVEQRRGMELELSSSEQTQIKSFAIDVVLREIKGQEGIS